MYSSFVYMVVETGEMEKHNYTSTGFQRRVLLRTVATLHCICGPGRTQSELGLVRATKTLWATGTFQPVITKPLWHWKNLEFK